MCARQRICVVIVLLVWCCCVVSSFPVKTSEQERGNGSDGGRMSWGLFVGLGLASCVCLVLVVSLCTCCGENLLNLKGDQSGGERRGSLEPPSSMPSTPGSVRAPLEGRQSVTIEPLPDLGNIQRRFPSSASLPRPLGFNQAVNKGINTQEWFAAECKTPDFPRSQLQYVKEICGGWFGQVVEGQGRITASDMSKKKLAVKILRDDASTMERAYFLYEARLNRDLTHTNILPLLAKCLDTESYLLLFDYYNTDLKSFLWKSRANSDELIQNGSLLRYSCQVSSGLSYIHENGFVYNDLACRNCVLSSDGCVKIGDFGISPQKYKDDYLVSGDIAIPVRWLAPEVVEVTGDGRVITKEITPAANTWTYGVVLWEILEFAKLPYMDLNTEGVLDSVVKEGSVRLLQPLTPVSHSDHLYEVMRMCWMPEGLRPSMSKIHAMVCHIEEHRQASGDFDVRWNSLLPKQAPDPSSQSAVTTASPVPADPSSSSSVGGEVEHTVIPTISLTSTTEPIPPVPAPRRMNNSEVPEISPVPPVMEVAPVLVERETMETPRGTAEVRSFQESETERKEKRDFVLSLSDDELSGFRTDELVQFYEFLSMEEIRDLESRHTALVKERDAKLEKEGKLKVFLAMDVDKMSQLKSGELEEYLSLVEDTKRQEILGRLGEREQRRKLVSMIKEGTPEELVRLTAQDLDKAGDVLQPTELSQLQDSISHAQMRLEREAEARKLRDGPDSLLTGLSEERLREVMLELVDTEAETLEERWRKVNGARQKARDEILGAEGLGLYLLSLNGLEQYFSHLSNDEVLTVTQRLEEVQRMREALLESSETEGFVDLGDENLSLWLTEEESLSVRGRREASLQQEHRRREILDAEGMDLFGIYKERWDEFFPILTLEERAGIQGKMNFFEEERRRLLDLSDNGLSELRPEDLENLSFYFNDQEFDRLRIRWEEARSERERKRNHVLGCSDSELLSLSESSGGMESFQAVLSDEEWMTIVRREEAARELRQNTRKRFMEAPEEDLWRLTEAELEEAKNNLSVEDIIFFNEKYQRSNDFREQKVHEISSADDKTLIGLCEGWQGLEAYKAFLTAEEMADVCERYERLKEKVEREREKFLSIPDSQLSDLSEADVEGARQNLTETDFILFQTRMDTALNMRKKRQEEIANLTDLELLSLEESGDLEGYQPFLNDPDFLHLKEKVVKLKKEREEILSASAAELVLGTKGSRDRWSQLLDNEAVRDLRQKQEEAAEAREGILNLPGEELIKLPSGRLESYYRYLTDEERQGIEKKARLSLEKKERFLGLTDDQLLDLKEEEREDYYELLTEEEEDEVKKRIESWKEVRASLHHVVKDDIGESVSPIPGHTLRFHAEQQKESERNSTSTPENSERPPLKSRRLASESLEPIEAPSGVGLNDAIVSDSDYIPSGTPALKREYDENRERIVNRTDDELKKIPLAEIENSYKYLAPEEIFSLQERVRKLQAVEEDWTMSDQQSAFSPSDRSLSVRSSLRRRRPLISELSQQSKSFLSNMSSISVFYLDDNMEPVNPLEARDVVLNAEDDALLMVPMEKLSEYYNCLTIEEIQDTQHRMMEARDMKRAELLTASTEELRAIEPRKLNLFLSFLPEADAESLRKTMADPELPQTQPQGIMDEPPPADFLTTTPSPDLSEVLNKNDAKDFLMTATHVTGSSGPVEDTERPMSSISDDFEKIEDIPDDFLDKFGVSTGISESEDSKNPASPVSNNTELLLDFGLPSSGGQTILLEGADAVPGSSDRKTPEPDSDFLGIGAPMTVSTPTSTTTTRDVSGVSSEGTTYYTADFQDLLGDFHTPQTSLIDMTEDKTPEAEEKKKGESASNVLSDLLGGKVENFEDILTSTLTPQKHPETKSEENDP